MGAMIDVMAVTMPTGDDAPAITLRFPAVTPPPAIHVAPAAALTSPPRSPVALSLPFPQTRTAPMAERAADPSAIECFPGERLAYLDDFIRMQIASRRITFLSVLDREGLTPQYYTEMTRRLDALMREIPALSAEYERRLRQALGPHAA